MIKKQLVLSVALFISCTPDIIASQSSNNNFHTNSLKNSQRQKEVKKDKDTRKRNTKFAQGNSTIRLNKENIPNKNDIVINSKLVVLENEIKLLKNAISELKKSSMVLNTNDKKRLYEIINRDIDLHELATSTLGEVNLLKKSLESIKELSKDGSLSNIVNFNENIKNLKFELINQSKKIETLTNEINELRKVQTDSSQISEVDRRMILTLAQNGSFESIDKLLESDSISQSDKDIITEIKTLGRKISSETIDRKVADEEFKKLLASASSQKGSESKITQALTSSLLVLSNNIKPIKSPSINNNENDILDDLGGNIKDLKPTNDFAPVSYPEFEDKSNLQNRQKSPKINPNDTLIDESSKVTIENNEQLNDDEEVIDILNGEDNEKNSSVDLFDDEQNDDLNNDDDLLE